MSPAPATSPAPTTATALNSPELLRRVNALRALDNATNWRYLAREWLFLLAAIGGAVALDGWRADLGLGWGWSAPAFMAAIALVGAGQHRLSTLAHEASHGMLFRHRLLNELASDWLCLFPLFSATHNYRLQHLAHHLHVNDPELDPDLAQLEESGHRFAFPMSGRSFVWRCVARQVFWLPGLVRYLAARAKYAALGGGSATGGRAGTKLPTLLAVAYLALLVAALLACLGRPDPRPLVLAPVGLWVAFAAALALLPGRHYPEPAIRPVIAPRWTMIQRLAHMALMLGAVAWLQRLTGRPAVAYFFLLWLVPLATSFSFFMILRQVVQHGNADRGRLTNTRVFRVHPLVAFAVFPLGMDDHLPHHLFPLVPHYRLKALHALLDEHDAYREAAEVAEGYFFPRDPDSGRPTVLDLMARPHA